MADESYEGQDFDNAPRFEGQDFDSLVAQHDQTSPLQGAAPTAYEGQDFDQAPRFEGQDFDALARQQSPAGQRPTPEGPIASGVREFAHSVIPGIVGGAVAPLGAAAGSVVPVAGSIAGGAAAFIGGSLATEYAQEKALNALGFDDSNQRAVNREANPKSSFAGGLAGGLATMSPVSGAETVAKSLLQRGAGAAAMGGFEAGGEAIQGEDFDPAKIAIAMAAGAAVPGVNRLGKRVQGPAENYLERRAADKLAHAATLDNSVETAAGDWALAESPPSTATAQTVANGNPQSAPTRSSREYAKDSEQQRYADALADPEAMRQFAHEEGLTEAQAREIARANYEPPSVTTGDIVPDVGAALRAAQPEKPPAQSPSEAQAQAPQVQGPPTPPGLAAVQKSIGRNRNKNGPKLPQPLPEPVVDAGFPKPGEPVAAGSEATPLPPEMPAMADAAIKKSKAAQGPDISALFTGGPKEIKGKTAEAHEVSDGQMEAGNYVKARSGSEFGKTTAWETRAGKIRRSKSDAPEPWEVTSPYDYGYWHKTKSTDGEQIDRAQPPVGSPEAGDKHFIIDQKDANTGKYDEPKTFTYVKDKAAAVDLYNRGFSDNKGPERMHDITEVSKDDLGAYLLKHSEKPPTKPYGKPMESAAAPQRASQLLRGDNEPGAPLQGTPKAERNHGNFPIEGRVGPDGQPVTANTKAKAAALSAEHKALVDWFDKSEPTPGESKGELLDRLKGVPTPKQAVFAPKEWMLAREAKKVLAKPTPAAIKKFREAEDMLRGSDEDVENYRSGNRIDADIGMSRRSGDDAIANAENKHVVPGLNEEENAILESIDRGKRGEGKFDVPHEEAESMVKPKAVKTKADLKASPRKTIDVRDSALVKSVEPFKMDAATKARKAESAALLGRQAEKPKTEADKGKQIAVKDFDPKDLARMVEMSNKAAARKGLSPDAIATYKNMKADLPKAETPTVARLFDQFGKDEGGALFGKANAARGKGFWDGLRKSLKTTPVKSYLAQSAKGPYGEYTRELGETFHRGDNQDKMHRLNLMEAAAKLPKSADLPALERIHTAREADSAHVDLPGKQAGKTNLESLSPEDKKIWDDHLQKYSDEANDFREAIKQVAPKREVGPDVEHYIARITRGDTSEYNLLRQNDDPTSPNYHGLKVTSGMAMERPFVALERVADGKRFVVQNRGEGEGFTHWDKHVGKRIKDPNYAFEANQPYTVTDKNGTKHDFIMREAMSKEIEDNARGRDGKGKPMRYFHNAALSVYLAHAQLGSMARHLAELARISSTKEFGELSANAGSPKAIKNGWTTSKMPNFEGVAMAPELRAVMDDYAKPGFDSPQFLRELNQRVTKLLFWMPTAHIANVAAHWFVGRGFDNANVARLYTTGAKAIKAVMAQNSPTTQRLLDAGAGLVYPSVRTRNFIEKMAKGVGEEMQRDPSSWGPIADKIGVPLKKLSDAIYDGSSKVMWAANDMFLTQRILELESKGHSTQEAIRTAERDIPNYRIPTNLFGSRTLAQFMSDPTFTSFGRYHVGMMNSYANIVKDAISTKSTMGDRVDAAGKMMALGVLAYVVYPVLDKLAQTVTGNEDAKQNRRGPVSIPSHLNAAFNGKEDIASAARSTLTVPPLWSTALEALSNKDWRGKSIVEPGTMTQGRYGKALVQEGEHLARGLVSPYGTFSTAEKRGEEEGASGVAKSTGRAIRDQALDEKNPSDAARNFANKQDIINFRNARSRDNRGGYGPAESAFDKLFPE